MPAASSKLTIAPSGTGKSQATAFQDAMHSLALAIGHTYLSIMTGDYTDGPTNYDSRERVMRMAPIDPHHSYVDMHAMGNSNLSSVTVWPMFDADVQKTGANGMGAGATVASILMWPGNWSGYPTGGAPILQSGGLINHSKVTVNFGSGTNSYLCRMMGSEYGIFWTANDGSATEMQECNARPTGTTRPGRNIEVRSLPVSAGPYTFVGPTGTLGVHLEFESDGKTIPITFPTGRPLTLWQVAQAITMQAGGFIAGRRHRLLGGVELLGVAVPKLRFPTAGIAATGITPRIRLTYQDPTFVAQGLNLARYTGISMDAGGVTSGLRGTLTRIASSWPAGQVRIGSIVYNRTLDATAIVKAVTTTTNPLDTMIVDDAGTGPTAWTDAHVYDVYPFCDHPHGVGIDGGQYQVTKWADPFDTIAYGADTKLVCNDLYGEAQGHFALNQGVMLNNNGCAVILDVDDVSGFVLGEFVQNRDTDAYGVIRAIDTVGDRLLIDTIQGRVLGARPSPGGYNRYLAWNEYDPAGATMFDTVVSYAHPDSPAKVGIGSAQIGRLGTPGISSSTNGHSTEGQSGLFQIIGISQAKDEVGGAADDYRTVLTIDTDASGVNPGFEVFPSAVIGIRARHRVMIDFNLRYPYHGPYCGGAALTKYQEIDLRYNELLRVAPQPTHTPDEDTSSFDLASLHSRMTSTPLGTGMLGAYAHFRMINIASPTAVSFGDMLPEQRDILRMWIANELAYGTNNYGAGTTNPAIGQRTCIGPADSSLA